MNIIGIHNVGLAVKSVREMGAFFIEKLDFKVDFRLDINPVFARVYFGDNYLYLFETQSQELIPKRKLFASKNYPGFDHIAITCDDVDQSYEAMRAKGVEFEGTPFTYPNWRVRMVPFKDPEGNWYHLFHRVLEEGDT